MAIDWTKARQISQYDANGSQFKVVMYEDEKRSCKGCVHFKEVQSKRSSKKSYNCYTLKDRPLSEYMRACVLFEEKK